MDLNHAVTFIRVVETGGFTSAASALGLPPSSVSRSVAKLELELGITLLERTTRKVSLTDAGRAYYERAREALAGLDEANALALDAAREPHGTVRLGVPPAFAPMMATAIAEFCRLYPRISIEVTASPRASDLVGETIDLAFVTGRQPDSALVSRRIGDVEHRLYAAPSYLAARGTPQRLDELPTARERGGHAAIALRSHPGGDAWELIGPDGPVTIDVHAHVRGDHAGFVMEAAVAGLGIALLPALPAGFYVHHGSLVPVLSEYRASSPLQLLTPATRLMPRRTALLRDHLMMVWSGRCHEAEAAGAKTGQGGCLAAKISGEESGFPGGIPSAPPSCGM
jgi:DNA-binding transcriptional LysR family regulator